MVRRELLLKLLPRPKSSTRRRVPPPAPAAAPWRWRHVDGYRMFLSLQGSPSATTAASSAARSATRASACACCAAANSAAISEARSSVAATSAAACDFERAMSASAAPLQEHRRFVEHHGRALQAVKVQGCGARCIHLGRLTAEGE